jgi:hypothetical protein
MVLLLMAVIFHTKRHWHAFMLWPFFYRITQIYYIVKLIKIKDYIPSVLASIPFLIFSCIWYLFLKVFWYQVTWFWQFKSSFHFLAELSCLNTCQILIKNTVDCSFWLMSLMQILGINWEITFWFYGNKHQTNELVVKHNSLFFFISLWLSRND